MQRSELPTCLFASWFEGELWGKAASSGECESPWARAVIPFLLARYLGGTWGGVSLRNTSVPVDIINKDFPSSMQRMVHLAEPSPLFHLLLEQEMSVAAGYCAGLLLVCCCCYLEMVSTHRKPHWLVHKIGQTPSFHPKTKWHCTHCTHSPPTQTRVASLLLSHLQPLTLGSCPGQEGILHPLCGQCSASSHSLFIDMHGCGRRDSSYREGWSLGLCYAMHGDVATCIFLVAQAGGICLDRQYLNPLLLLIAILLCQKSDGYLPKESRHNLYLS